MVSIQFDNHFKKAFIKIKDSNLKNKIIKQIQKLQQQPEIGKPMRFSRKGSRELYILPFRLSYAYIKRTNTIILLDIYHKDKQ